MSAEGGRVAYAWDACLTEWYVNDSRGLEHGYTVHRRPERDEQNATSPLTFTLFVRGELRAEVARNGRDVRFLHENGAVALTYTGLSVLDADGRELEAGFEVLVDGGEKLLLSVDERGARYPLVIDPVAQQAYLKASNTDADDRFGTSVAVSGDTVVVGAAFEDSNATGVNGDQSDDSTPSAGAVYVFVRNGSSWSQEAYLKASNTGGTDEFGRTVAISGETVVVGAYGEASNATGVNGNQGDNSANAAGAAYVFVRNGTSWSQEAYLKASNTDANDRFGTSVGISDDTVVVGARAEDSNATGVNGGQSDNSAFDCGAAYVFVRIGTSWSGEAYLKASNTNGGDSFGWSCAVSGNTVVVGAIGEKSNATGVNGNQNNNGASFAGAAYVFVRNGTTWTQEAYVKASNTEASDRFGSSAAVSGDTLVVGARGEDSNATGVNGDEVDNSASLSGAGYVFVRSGTSWSQEAYLKAFNTDADDEFGDAAAISGDTVVIGAKGEDSSATGVNGSQSDNTASNAGAAYVFSRSGSSWTQELYFKASNTGANDRFGNAVAVSGDTVVIGAPPEDSDATGVNGDEDDDSASAAGAACVFLAESSTTYCLAVLNSTGFPAAISATGSPSVAANAFRLRASPVPVQPGLFFYGCMQTQVPFGNGFRCVGGMLFRLDVENADASGVLEHLVDFTNPPTAMGQIVGGATWYFQAWYRDPTVPPTFFNLSNGLSVTFTQ